MLSSKGLTVISILTLLVVIGILVMLGLEWMYYGADPAVFPVG